MVFFFRISGINPYDIYGTCYHEGSLKLKSYLALSKAKIDLLRKIKRRLPDSVRFNNNWGVVIKVSKSQKKVLYQLVILRWNYFSVQIHYVLMKAEKQYIWINRKSGKRCLYLLMLLLGQTAGDKMVMETSLLRKKIG